MTGFDKLKSDIKAKAIKHLYVLYGTETYLLSYYVDKLKNLVIGENADEFNYMIFKDESFTLDSFSSAIETMPFTSENKFVLVKGVNPLSFTEGQLDDLQKMVSDIPEFCYLVFVITDTEFSPDKRKKAFTFFQKLDSIVEFGPISKNDLIAWIIRRFSAVEKDIDSQTADYLIFYSGNLMEQLILEIDKLSSYVRGRKIEKKHIVEIATPQFSSVVFDITNAIAVRDYEKAISVLSELEAQKVEPLSILALISRQLRQMLGVKLAAEKSIPVSRVASIFGLSSDYHLKILSGSVSKVSKAWIQYGLLRCAELDFSIKTSQLTDPIKDLLLSLANFREPEND